MTDASTFTTRLSTCNRISVPARIRRQLGLRYWDSLRVTVSIADPSASTGP